ncbi:MAG TPA: DUF5996 family protein [Longimicrobiaceae bacterium]|jgi:hypothetical protein|nr:DUF5996 family protein [Longimicrobiaceae bacterium]
MSEQLLREPEEAGEWPALPLAEWQDTRDTLHMWTQVVGKIRLAQAPAVNHWWHTPLYVTSRGLTTSPVPYGGRSFQIDFDFIDHALRIHGSHGAIRTVALRPRSVADFYGEVMAKLGECGFHVRIWTRPVEVENAIPFERDEQHASYDPAAATRFWRALSHADRVLQRFRAEFIGKSSPVHFFWGSFDLAVTRFSGRRAPQHPGGIPNLGDWVAREAYSHEVSSVGWWPGGPGMPEPVFYAYAYPEPPGYAEVRVRPAEARYDATLREFVYPYEAARRSPDPDAAVLDFCRSTYDASADLSKWDRASLDRGGANAGPLP